MKKLFVVFGLLLCTSVFASTTVTIVINSSLAQAQIRKQIVAKSRSQFFNSIHNYFNGVQGGLQKAAVTVTVGSDSTVTYSR